MGRTPVALIAAFCMMTGAASAQVAMGVATPPGVRYNPAPPQPASPPANPDPGPNGHHHARPHHSPNITVGNDVFLARPDTYKPRRDALPSFVGYGSYPAVVVPEVVFFEPASPKLHRSEGGPPVVVERTKVIYVEREPEPAADPSPAPRVAAAPKTLYVIPRCYAGDRRPDVRDLPVGCDIRDMRIIRP